MWQRKTITFKSKIKYLFKATKYTAAHQPSFREMWRFPFVCTNPTGYDFLPTHYQKGLPSFERKSFSLSLHNEINWRPNRVTKELEALLFQSLPLTTRRSRQWL